MSVTLDEVVGGAGREVAEDDLLGGAAAEQHRHLVLQLLARHQEAVLGRALDGVAERADAARDDRDLVHRVGSRAAPSRPARGPSRGTRRRGAPSRSAGGSSSPGRRRCARSPALKSASVTASAPRRVASSAASLTRLARSAPVKPGRERGDLLEVDVGGELHLLRVHLQDLRCGPVLSGRSTSTWRSKRPARSSAGSRISGRLVAASSTRPGARIEAVELDQQLVQRLLLLVVAAQAAGAARAAERVELVDEDDRRRLLPRLLEQVAHARRADADEHLDELRAGDREERHAGLAGDRAREQRLAGARRPDQQHALRARARRGGRSASGSSGTRPPPAARPSPRRRRPRRRR